MDTREFTITALLTALYSHTLCCLFKVIIPPFTATLGSRSHVPVHVPGAPGCSYDRLGSALGFLTLGPLVGARAFMHVFVALAGSVMIQREVHLRPLSWQLRPARAPGGTGCYALCAFDAYLFIITGVGTMLHHGVDAAISYVMLKLLQRSRVFSPYAQTYRSQPYKKAAYSLFCAFCQFIFSYFIKL